MTVQSIVSNFSIASPVSGIRECKAGHINSTYFVTCEDGSEYVLQKINTYVFKDPEGLMENVFKVTGYIGKVLTDEGKDPTGKVLRYIACRDGKKYFSDDESNAWRMYEFIGNTHTEEVVSSEDVFRKVGYAFGNFQKQLDGFDSSELSEVIPDFHNTVKRYENFLRALENNKSGRADLVKNEIAFVRARENICGFIVNGLRDGLFPSRVTHNDTKLSNILLDDETGEPACVIDLDTIMPGSLLYDFGDSIRGGATAAAEDEKDLSKVYMRTPFFRACAEGFVEGAGDSITNEEILSLPMSAIVITLETGIRFLTDYLDGDVYFRVDYPEHNLDRARNQFRLVSDMEEKLPEWEFIVRQLTK